MAEEIAVHGRDIDSAYLLQSLETATITEIEWKGRWSRSGNTFFLHRLRAVLSTNKHEHELDCKPLGVYLMCSWSVDGREMGVVELKPGHPLYEYLMNTLETLLKTENIDISDRGGRAQFKKISVEPEYPTGAGTVILPV